MIVFLIWLITAQWLYQSLFGYGSPESIGQFLSDILTTSEGWILIIAGNGIGFLFAVLVLTISVVSFPLLLDRDDRLVAVLRWARGGVACARPFDLASLPQGGGTGTARSWNRT